MDPTRNILSENLQHVEQRIAAACRRVGRNRSEVTLIGVTKMVSAEVAQILFELGVLDLGENRPQELWRKAEQLPPEVHWHLIGHLQRNKIDRTLPLVQAIHSVDSLRLLEALENVGPTKVFLEFNCSGEASKQGFSETDLVGLVAALPTLEQVRVIGLMTMAAPADDPNEARPTFALLRGLCDRLRAEVGAKHPLTGLSMGMSGDFEVAVEEGATHIRLGTVLFEGLPSPGEKEG